VVLFSGPVEKPVFTVYAGGGVFESGTAGSKHSIRATDRNRMTEMHFMLGGVAFAAVGAWWDVRTRRIPNSITYSGIVSGLLLRTAVGGWLGAKEALAGGLLAGGVFLLFFLVKAMGAGDVKLIAAVCSWSGLHQAWVILIATALAGGVVAVVYMVMYGRVGRTLRNIGILARFHLASGLQPHPEISLENARCIRMPYAVAIAAGSLYAFGSTLQGR
jgi:prepilin peptidase CpaA